MVNASKWLGNDEQEAHEILGGRWHMTDIFMWWKRVTMLGVHWKL